jgi:hypothetical protein
MMLDRMLADFAFLDLEEFIQHSEGWNASIFRFPWPKIIYFCILDAGMQAAFGFLGFK